MRNLSFLFVASIALVSAEWVSAASGKVEDFALLDHEGSFHQLRKYADTKALVLISVASDCPENSDKLSNYRSLRANWERRGVTFLAIDSSSKDGINEVRTMATAYSLELPILLDDSQLVAESLGITKAGQIIILAPSQRQVLYRGGLGADRLSTTSKPEISVITNTLSKAISGNLDMIEAALETAAEGCELDFPSLRARSNNVPDFAKDVAPILKDKCVSCHIVGGIAPFAMDSHSMVQGWSSMIKEVLMTKRMPPAQVDPTINHFINAGYINASDLRTLVHWIDAGAPAAESGIDPLLQLESREAIWELGEPDYILELPAFRVPATGVLDYEEVSINLPFEDDVWVESVQHIPGDRRVLHHLTSYVVSPARSESSGNVNSEAYMEFLEGYAPGKEDAVSYPQDTGVFIPVGSAVQMSLHYTTFGKEVVDRTMIGLYFAKQRPKYRYSTLSLSHAGERILIPPFVDEHKMTASYIFQEEIMLHGLRPHMHYRGKHMRMSAIYPNGARQDIINVPNYSFEWQRTYRLAEPILLPEGTRVLIEGAFDNSHHNLGNPDPSATVRGGAQSWDEMFIGYFSYQRMVK
ncbi:MAG: redoxin domain-containing protein [Gammaproteobacteria bacterium]|nr:redoxin domain-containing protein [Gammaproteobacteria bacterium]